MQTLELTVRNEKASLETARLAMLDFVAGRGLSARALYRLELVLEEMLMNLIWYAYPLGGAHDIRVALKLDPASATLIFEDDGIPFNPLKEPPPVMPTSLQDAPEGGRGILLTRKAAKSWTYAREFGRNRSTLHLAIE